MKLSLIITMGMKLIVRICIVPTMFPKYKGDYYGSFVFDDAKELVKNGFEVHVVTQHNPGIPYEEIMEGVNVHRFKWLEPKEFKALVHFKGFIDNLRLITYLFSLFFNLIWIVRKFDVDIIHTHSVIPTGLIGVIISKIIRKPVFITVHGMDVTNFENNPIYERFISFSLKNCNKVIAVSEYLANIIISFGPNQDNIIILRNAVDQKRFRPYRNKKLCKQYKINDENIVILFVGYLDEFKGIFELVDAFFEISTNNKSGFSALPGGYRFGNSRAHSLIGKFSFSGNYGYWWSNTELNDSTAFGRFLDFGQSNFGENYANKRQGQSVRLLKDN